MHSTKLMQVDMLLLNYHWDIQLHFRERKTTANPNLCTNQGYCSKNNTRDFHDKYVTFV